MKRRGRSFLSRRFQTLFRRIEFNSVFKSLLVCLKFIVEQYSSKIIDINEENERNEGHDALSARALSCLFSNSLKDSTSRSQPQKCVSDQQLSSPPLQQRSAEKPQIRVEGATIEGVKLGLRSCPFACLASTACPMDLSSLSLFLAARIRVRRTRRTRLASSTSRMSSPT